MDTATLFDHYEDPFLLGKLHANQVGHILVYVHLILSLHDIIPHTAAILLSSIRCYLSHAATYLYVLRIFTFLWRAIHMSPTFYAISFYEFLYTVWQYKILIIKSRAWRTEMCPILPQWHAEQLCILNETGGHLAGIQTDVVDSYIIIIINII